ncbi:MAG TPA: alginate export family protein, partial [Thermodesulfobacteriota bacterium]
FDGLKFNYAQEGINVDLFHMTIAEDTTSANDDTRLTGVYATLGGLIPNNTLDLYAINKNGNDENVLNFYTVGVRLKGAVAGLDYTLEVPYQFGEMFDGTDDNDLSAWALAAKAGYTIPGAPMNIRIGAEYDYATGDDDSTDNDIDTFQSLYPTNHAHFGIGDFTTATNTWSNIQAWSINASADVTEKIRLYAAYWDYSLAEENTAGDDDLGSEIDLIATYKYSNNVSLEAGASRFMPDDATATSPDDAADWAYLQITANF